MFHDSQFPDIGTIGKQLLFLVCFYAFVPHTLAQTTTIAFASCINDERPNHPIWNVLLDSSPDVSIFMGDNVYLDLTRFSSASTIDDFKGDYDRLEKTTKFQSLRESSRVLAIWDDNDYGQRDGDRSFEFKEISKQKFVEFWNIDPSSDRAKRAGNYDSAWIGEEEQKIQVILSDTRYFRSPWTRDSNAKDCSAGDIVPTDDGHATILGEAQWNWLEQQLKEPAVLHIFVSGIQVIPLDHCFERWAGIPPERDRLLRLLSQASARVIILSGDRHLAETSRLPSNETLNIKNDLFEFTSSSLTSRTGFGANEQNRFRVTKENIRVNNFGLLTVDWELETLLVVYHDQKGQIMQQLEISIPIDPVE